jgi:hydroxymethylbilane synthase
LQVNLQFPGVQFTEIRGNVDTRLRKIGQQKVADATILAAAGLKRLGIASWPDVNFVPFEFAKMVPAVGQGAIAVQCREGDAAKFASVFDAPTMRAVTLERAFQNALGGGCHTAFAAHVSGDTLYLFHENIGHKSFALAAADFASPTQTANRILKDLGLIAH